MCKMHLLLSISYRIPYLSLATGSSLSSGCVSTVLHHFYIKLSIIEPARNAAVTIFRVRLIWYSFYELNVLAANADYLWGSNRQKGMKRRLLVSSWDCLSCLICQLSRVTVTISVAFKSSMLSFDLPVKSYELYVTLFWLFCSILWRCHEKRQGKRQAALHTARGLWSTCKLCVLLYHPSTWILHVAWHVSVTTQSKTKKICEDKRYKL